MGRDRSQNSGCLLAFLGIFGGKEAAEPAVLPYRTRDDFLSPAELSFRNVLLLVVKEQVVICPKVNLSDIFFVGKSENRGSHYNRIAQKHVDFLLCDAKTLKPLAGVELDDASHSRLDRQERDEFVDRVFQAAGLPLVHITAQRDYNWQAIAAQVLLHLSKQPLSPTPMPTLPVAQPSSTPTTTASKGTPVCSKCGIPMVLRTARSGPNAGETFYGCLNYPSCREMKQT